MTIAMFSRLTRKQALRRERQMTPTATMPSPPLTPADIQREIDARRALLLKLKAAHQAEALAAAEGDTRAIDSRAFIAEQIAEVEVELEKLLDALPAARRRERETWQREQATLLPRLA